MGVQAQDTSSGKSTTPPQASWEGTTGRTDVGYTNLTAADAWNKPQAAAPAPAPTPAPKGVNNYSFTYADGTTGNSPWKLAADGTYVRNADGSFVGGTFNGRTMPDGSINRATIGNVTSDGMVDLYGGYQVPADVYYGNGNEASTGQRPPNGYGYGTLAEGPGGTAFGGTSSTGSYGTTGGGGSGAYGSGDSIGGVTVGGVPVGGGSAGSSRSSSSYGGGGFGAPPVQGPVDDASRRRVEEAILSRLEPQFQQDEANLRNRLIASGLEVGSHAYNTELDRLKRSQTDARMQAILAGGTEESRQVGLNAQLQSTAFNQGLQGAQFDNQVRQQMLSELLLQRNTSLNELNSLRTGSQVSMPNFQGYYTNNATPAPLFDAAQSTGNYNMAAWQQQQAGANALLGSLATLGGAGIIRYSDARLKEDIRPIGQTPGGVNLYSWKWKDGSGEDSGVIAQEVVLSHPEAVSTDTSGFLMVDYSKLS